MALLTKESSAAWAALAYITVGALMVVWTVVYFAFQWNHHGADGHASYYWCAGFLATGVTLFVIGLALGRIGRAARAAELPPHDAALMVAATEQNEAARAAPTIPVQAVNPAMTQGMVMNPAPAVPVQVVGGVPVQSPVAPGQPVRAG
jgi:hypothetical protein